MITEQVTNALPQRDRGDGFDDIDELSDALDGGSYGRPAEYLAPSIIFPEVRLACTQC